ncbi:MAG: tetratricopeptide repeat protein [Patescibacteria group bacterium]
MESTKIQQNRETFIEMLLNVLPTILAFLVPIFFLPLTSEFFEFNKLMLITVSTIFMLFVWALKMLFNKKVYMAKSSIDLPLMLLTVVFILATVFSIDKTSSIYGKYGRWFPSVSGIITLVSFYYVVASNTVSEKIIKNTVFAFIFGATIASIVALLRYFGVTLGSAAFLQAPNFTLTGSATSTVILAALGAVLSVVFLTYEKSIAVKILLVQTAAVNFMAVALLNLLPGWAVLSAGLLGFLIFVPINKALENKQHLTALLGVGVALVLALLLPTSRDLVVNNNYPKEITLGARESWVVALSTVRDFPVLGSGPSTFYLNFPRYRPLTLNTTELWNIRFDKPFNEVFGIMASIGILGLLATAFFVYKTIKFLLNHREFEDETGTTAALNIGIMALLVSYVFTYATVVSTFTLFLFLAMAVAKSAVNAKSKHAEIVLLSLSASSFSSMSIIGSFQDGNKRESLQYVIALPMLLALLAGGYLSFKVYASEYYTRKAIKSLQANNGTATYDFQSKAIKYNPRRDVYRNAYVQTNIALANTLAANENLSDSDKATIQQLIAQAIQETRTSTEVLNPLNVGAWESRGQVYRALIGVAQESDTWAIRSYSTAVQLDPTNPRLRVDLGGIYYLKGDYLSAANLFREATRLKPDYANGYYNLANALKQLNAPQDALKQLEIAQRLVEAGSPDAERIAAEIEALKANPTVAGVTTQTGPTVEELAQQGLPEEQKEETAPQEPLSIPRENNLLEAQDLQTNTENNSTETETKSEGTQPNEQENQPIEVVNNENQ